MNVDMDMASCCVKRYMEKTTGNERCGAMVVICRMFNSMGEFEYDISIIEEARVVVQAHRVCVARVAA